MKFTIRAWINRTRAIFSFSSRTVNILPRGKRDLNHLVEYPERDCVFYRLTNSERRGRYRLVKHVLTDPHRSVLLVHTKVEVLDESLRGKLRLTRSWRPTAPATPRGVRKSALPK